MQLVDVTFPGYEPRRVKGCGGKQRETRVLGPPSRIFFLLTGLENEGWFDPWCLLQGLRQSYSPWGPFLPRRGDVSLRPVPVYVLCWWEAAHAGSRLHTG